PSAGQPGVLLPSRSRARAEPRDVPAGGGRLLRAGSSADTRPRQRARRLRALRERLHSEPRDRDAGVQRRIGAVYVVGTQADISWMARWAARAQRRARERSIGSPQPRRPLPLRLALLTRSVLTRWRH